MAPEVVCQTEWREMKHARCKKLGFQSIHVSFYFMKPDLNGFYI